MQNKTSTFILNRHEEEFSKMQELRAEDLTKIAGGGQPGPCETLTVTPNSDGGDDGIDEC